MERCNINFLPQHFLIMLLFIFIVSCTSVQVNDVVDVSNLRKELLSFSHDWKETQQKCDQQDKEFQVYDTYWLVKKYKNNLYLNTVDPESSFLYGRLLGMLNQEEEALTHFYDALQKDPEYIWSYYSIGIVHLKKNAYRQAYSFMQKSISLNPVFIPGLLVLATLKARNNHEEALLLLQQAEEYDAKNPIIKQNIANLFSQQQEYNKSLSIYEEASKLDEENIDILNDWSKLLLKLKKYKQALQILEQIYALMPENSAKKEMAKTILLVANLAREPE